MSNVNGESPLKFPKRFAPSAFFFGGALTRCFVFLLGLLVAARPAASAQGRFYGGVLAGVSTISGDASSRIQPPNSSASSLYDPKNGLTFSAMVGRDVSEYVSVQANYLWNGNRLKFDSSSTTNGTLTAYEETRSSSQQRVLADVMVYFRVRGSRFRPYLGVGTGWVHFRSDQEQVMQSVGTLALPARTFSSDMVALHTPVGLDVKLGSGWKFRYAFSETLTRNPISERLSPPGSHRLMSFESLFGIVRQF